MSNTRGPSRITDEVEFVPTKRTRSNIDIPLSALSFKEILDSDSFVDKTMLIKEVISDLNTSFLVTAPRGFGKSLNARMLASFLTIEVDEFGNRKTNSKDSEPVRDTDNYRLFTEPIPKLPDRNLKISAEIDIMNKHLGKYPVIFIDFRSASVCSLKDAIAECKRIIHKTFLAHSYLHKSSKLDTSEKAICEKWSSKTELKSFDKSDVLGGLESLSMFLLKHFNHKCFVIVDEYDSMCTSAMFKKVTEPVLEEIIEFFLSCLDLLCKENDNVEANFFTGISHMCTTGLSKLRNIISQKFLQNDKFGEFYGLTCNEIQDLKQRFSISQADFEKALDYYNGYYCKRRRIISIWSFLSFIKFHEIRSFWKDSGVCTNLKKSTFRSSMIKFWVVKLLSNIDNTVEIRLFNKVRVDQIIELKEMCEKPNIELNDPSLLFNFLLEQGYLTISNISEDSRTANVQIPNIEIWEEFEELLLSYYTTIKGLNFTLIKTCAVFWDNINFSDEEAVKESLREICKLLNEIIEPVLLEKKNEACLHHLLFVILLHTKYKCSSEVTCAPGLNRCRIDILLVHEKNVIISELEYERNVLEALNQIIDKNYCDIFEKNDNFIEDVENYLLLGISMTSDEKITINALLNNRDINNEIKVLA